MRLCVYTVLTGGYETLNEQKMAGGAIPFICLTDDPALRSESWEMRLLPPLFPGDLLRSQRAGKLLAHKVLPEFDASIYIDNTVLLQAAPTQILDAVNLTSGMAIPAHSFRASLLDEFAAVAEEKLDDPGRIAEQLAHYRIAFPEILAVPPTWSGIQIRDHRNPTVAAAMEIWLAHLCRYSRRDQLSGTVAFHLAGLRPNILQIDNYKSWFHTWPHAPARKVERRLWPEDAAAARILALELELASLWAAHDTVLNSTSWRALAPLRALGRKFKQP